MEKEIKLIFNWLQKKSDVHVAYHLGYRNSSVIDQWRRTHKVPSYQIKRLLELIDNERAKEIAV